MKRFIVLAAFVIVLGAVPALAQDHYFVKADIKQIQIIEVSSNSFRMIVVFNTTFGDFDYNATEHYFSTLGEATAVADMFSRGKIKGFRYISGGSYEGLAIAPMRRLFFRSTP